MKRIEILLSVNQDDISKLQWRAISESKDWLKLKAVQNHKVQHTPGYAWFECPWIEYTAFNHDRFLDEVLKLFATELP